MRREISVTITPKSETELEYIFIDNESGDVKTINVNTIKQSTTSTACIVDLGKELYSWGMLLLDEYEKGD